MFISIGWLIAFIAISIATIPLVRILGPVGIKNYVLEEYYDSDTGVYNVFYRIVSPALCCTVFVSLLGVIALAVGFSAPVFGFLPLIFYWLLLAAIKISRKTALSYPAFLLEAVISIGIAVLFNQFVVTRLLSYDFGFIDDSNIAFQAEMAVLAFLVQVIVSLLTRRRYKVSYCDSSRSGYSNASQNQLVRSYSRYSSVDVSEKKLYEFEHQFGSMLSKRFESDPLLRCVFFSIMAIEDANRPKGFRFLERIACSLGIANSTGIMQQKSSKPLSDCESVKLAVPYVEQMWDRFLTRFARSVESSYSSEVFTFTSSWYKYDYSVLADATEKVFGFFYGDYCGTRLLDAGFVFRQVRTFLERGRYGFLPRTVISSWRTSPAEAFWFGEEEVYWEDDYTVSRIELPESCEGCRCLSISGNADVASIEAINELCKCIESASGMIAKVGLVKDVYASILVYYKTELEIFSDNKWRIVHVE